MKFLNCYIVIIISILMPMNYGFAQELIPPIHNYSSTTYRAASQNWDIDASSNGIIYAANNQGLLSFDGQSWELHTLPNGGIVRSVFVNEDKIYTGSYKEFGFWTEDATGNLFYTSLIPSFEKNAMKSEEIWGIISHKDAIYFRSFGAIYKYKKDKIQEIDNVVSNKMIVYRGNLIVAVRNKGLFYLDDEDKLKPMPNQKLLQNQLIVDMAVANDTLLVGTREALYTYTKEGALLYPDTKLLSIIQDSELNHIITTEHKLLIGTVKNGLVNYDLESKKQLVLNRNNGLQNNTVLGFVKKRGNLWLSLDNGIDRVELDSPINYYTDDTGELGAVYDLAFNNGKMYLGSNTGVYTFKGKKLSLVEGARGHTWNLSVFINTLYANHNTGTYKVVRDTFIPIENTTGSFNMAVVSGDSYFINSYTGIINYNTANNSLTRLDSVDFPVKNIAFEDDHTIWAAHPYEGMYRIELNSNFKSVKALKRIELPGGGNTINTNIFRINNHLALYNGKQWLSYNSFNDSIESFEELATFSGYKLLLKDEDFYWFNNTREHVLELTNFDTSTIIASKKLYNRLVKNYEKIIKKEDSVYYVALNDGFASIDLKELFKDMKLIAISKPVVKGIKDTQKRYSLSELPEIPYKNARNINIKISLPVSDAVRLNYEIKGEDYRSGVIKNGRLNLRNLDHGEYSAVFTAVGPQGNLSETSTLNFVISPPWYLSSWMKFVYVILCLGLVFCIYWFNKLKLRKQQLLLEEKFKKEHKERLRILEKERLLNEITLKRKELANTTMVAAKKNEVLMEIQDELRKDKNNLSNQFKKKHIMNKINKAVKNKDEWKIFETNFNELHADFFKDILERYPKLSSKDLKLCSYLKMNLTSKEIAPLMGISVRGVEVHRYRLRKKMKLDKKENLSRFLIQEF